jgi:glycosyltransferase involved in cell wall biosynthesis
MCSVCTHEERKLTEFCCVASISKRKGQHYIIDALKMFKKNAIPQVHFTFVGDGSDRMKLEEDVCKCGLGDYVSFVGVSHNVDEHLVNSDVYILPSEDEGLPMAIIEAMRASLPIVSTPVGGIPEMIEDGVNGLLIQPDANDIYTLLTKKDSYDWQSLGRNARKTFEEKFTVEKMVDGYSKLLSF